MLTGLHTALHTALHYTTLTACCVCAACALRVRQVSNVTHSYILYTQLNNVTYYESSSRTNVGLEPFMVQMLKQIREAPTILYIYIYPSYALPYLP